MDWLPILRGLEKSLAEAKRKVTRLRRRATSESDQPRLAMSKYRISKGESSSGTIAISYPLLSKLGSVFYFCCILQ